MASFKKIIKSVALEGVKYLAEQAKKTYPAFKSCKNNICDKFSSVDYRSYPDTASQMFNNVSEMVSKKVNELTKANKAVEKEKKKSKKKIIKYSLIAGGSGLVIGAGAGYLLTKNNQIIQSDYIYNDSFIPNNTPEPITPQEYVCYPKSFEPYKDGYFISSDGTTIIKKVNN